MFRFTDLFQKAPVEAPVITGSLPVTSMVQVHRHPVRCESGFVLVGDPCYLLTPDAAPLGELMDDVHDPNSTLACGNKSYAHIGGLLALLLKVPTGTHTALTVVEDYEVQEFQVRFDGGTDPLIFEEGLHLEGSVAVDAGIVGVHDPSLTMFGEGGFHWKSWEEFCAQTFAPEVDARVNDGQPACPDSSDLLAFSRTAYGDGVYDAALFFEADHVAGVAVRFAWDEDWDEDAPES